MVALRYLSTAPVAQLAEQLVYTQKIFGVRVPVGAQSRSCRSRTQGGHDDLH